MKAPRGDASTVKKREQGVFWRKREYSYNLLRVKGEDDEEPLQDRPATDRGSRVWLRGSPDATANEVSSDLHTQRVAGEQGRKRTAYVLESNKKRDPTPDPSSSRGGDGSGGTATRL